MLANYVVCAVCMYFIISCYCCNTASMDTGEFYGVQTHIPMYVGIEEACQK